MASEMIIVGFMFTLMVLFVGIGIGRSFKRHDVVISTIKDIQKVIAKLPKS